MPLPVQKMLPQRLKALLTAQWTPLKALLMLPLVLLTPLVQLLPVPLAKLARLLKLLPTRPVKLPLLLVKPLTPPRARWKKPRSKRVAHCPLAGRCQQEQGGRRRRLAAPFSCAQRLLWNLSARQWFWPPLTGKEIPCVN
jgi:hypothetical protein